MTKMKQDAGRFSTLKSLLMANLVYTVMIGVLYQNRFDADAFCMMNPSESLCKTRRFDCNIKPGYHLLSHIFYGCLTPRSPMRQISPFLFLRRDRARLRNLRMS